MSASLHLPKNLAFCYTAEDEAEKLEHYLATKEAIEAARTQQAKGERALHRGFHYTRKQVILAARKEREAEAVLAEVG